MPWQRGAGLPAQLERWRDERTVWPNLVLDHTLPSRGAVKVPVPERAATRSVRSGARRARHRPSSTRTRPRRSSSRGAGSTSWSPRRPRRGKSLCFHLPVLDALAREPTRARALPLSRPRRWRAIRRQALRGADARRRARSTARSPTTATRPATRGARRASAAGIVLTNPDMLHAGILPHHAALGAHCSRTCATSCSTSCTPTAASSARTSRTCCGGSRASRAFTARTRVFVFAIGDHRQPARARGAPARRADEVALVDESRRAARARARVFVYNPPVVNAELGIRASYAEGDACASPPIWCAPACRPSSSASRATASR